MIETLPRPVLPGGLSDPDPPPPSRSGTLGWLRALTALGVVLLVVVGVLGATAANRMRSGAADHVAALDRFESVAVLPARLQDLDVAFAGVFAAEPVGRPAAAERLAGAEDALAAALATALARTAGDPTARSRLDRLSRSVAAHQRSAHRLAALDEVDRQGPEPKAMSEANLGEFDRIGRNLAEGPLADARGLAGLERTRMDRAAGSGGMGAGMTRAVFLAFSGAALVFGALALLLRNRFGRRSGVVGAAAFGLPVAWLIVTGPMLGNGSVPGERAVAGLADRAEVAAQGREVRARQLRLVVAPNGTASLPVSSPDEVLERRGYLVQDTHLRSLSPGAARTYAVGPAANAHETFVRSYPADPNFRRALGVGGDGEGARFRAASVLLPVGAAVLAGAVLLGVRPRFAEFRRS